MAVAIIVIVATGVDTIVAEVEDSVVADVVDAEEVEAEFVINSKTMALALSATAAVTPTTQQIIKTSSTGAKGSLIKFQHNFFHVLTYCGDPTFDEERFHLQIVTRLSYFRKLFLALSTHHDLLMFFLKISGLKCFQV